MKRLLIVSAFLSALLLILPNYASSQSGAYDLWFCLEQCDESNRDQLAVTKAELFIDAHELDLTSLAPEQLNLLDLAVPNIRAFANGCIVTHINEGTDFNPGIDWFSLVEWRVTSETTITIEAPQDPPGYTLALWFKDEIGGIGRSRSNPIFISGSQRADHQSIDCFYLASTFERP